MSTVIAVNDGSTAVLATDSRGKFLSGSFTDAVPKIFEIAPGVFYAMSGHTDLAEEQIEIAARLARTADFDKPEDFADALDRLSQPAMERVRERITELRSSVPDFEEQATGAMAFHTYVLAFISRRCPGFITRSFYLQNGRIEGGMNGTAFQLPAGSRAQLICGEKFIQPLVCDPRTWADGPIRASERLIDGLRSAHPDVGGATQMVLISPAGAQWIHRPPCSRCFDGAVVVSQIGPAFSVVLEQLQSMSNSGLTPGVAAAGTYTWNYSPTGPAVIVGAAGAIFEDNYGTPANTVTVNSSGINVTGGAGSGVTIQDAAGSNKVQLSSTGITITGPGTNGIQIQQSTTGPAVKFTAGGGVQLYDNISSPSNTVQILSTGITITGPGGITIQQSALGQKLTVNAAGLGMYLSNNLVLSITFASGIQIFNPAGSAAMVTLTNTSLTLAGPSTTEITLDNAGNAEFVGAGGFTTTINGNTINTGMVTANIGVFGELKFNGGGAFASATAGSASALPGPPAGYQAVAVSGTLYKVAYWNL
jgi:hypothetical protein